MIKQDFKLCEKASLHILRVLIILLIACTAQFLFAHESRMEPGAENQTPRVLDGVGIIEHLGEKVDSKLIFVDESGAKVTLGEFFRTGRPVVLDLAYYACPGLCNYHLNGFSEGLKKTGLIPGKDYEWVIISIDPKEKPELARTKKQNMIAAFGSVGKSEAETNRGWHFLTGEKQNIDALAKQVGFLYRWVPEEKQFAHVSAAYVVTPEAKISRYLKGVEFNPQTVKLSLIEARSGGVSSIVDSLILYCFHYDAKASKYSLEIMKIARIVGALTALLLLIVIGPNILKGRRSEK